MGLIKTFDPADWHWDRPVVVPVRVSSRGLVGHDRAAFLKQASPVFLDKIAGLEVGPDFEPVHLIAFGAHEAWGLNRNGDGFKEAECKAHFPTFVKYANWYVNHKNKPPENVRYGRVKFAAYNDAMRRVELLVLLYKNAAAAERDGGRVDHKALEKLAAGKDPAVSMSCRVPYDECNACGNKAVTRKQYCTAQTCKAGGCKDNLARIVKLGSDTHHLGVFNPRPCWFDISHITSDRPADRTAFATRADYVTKAAAEALFREAGHVGDAGGATLDALHYHDDPASLLVKLAHGVAALETQVRRRDEAVLVAFTAAVQPAADFSGLSARTKQADEVLAALADRHAVLPLREFARLEGKTDLAEAAARLVPGMCSHAVKSGAIEEVVAQPSYPLAAVVPSAAARRWAEKHAEAYSLDREIVAGRASTAVLRGATAAPLQLFTALSPGGEKSGADRLAADYVGYELAALARMATDVSSFPLTAKLMVLQNQNL